MSVKLKNNLKIFLAGFFDPFSLYVRKQQHTTATIDIHTYRAKFWEHVNERQKLTKFQRQAAR